MVLAYGWQELLRELHIVPLPQSAGDVSRCILILSAWLWPVPAIVIGFALSRIDQSMLEQASIDGVFTRLLIRRMMLPGVLSLMICLMISMQEFSIFEPTGISVAATEVRMIFETGTLSSASNPIAALVGGVGVANASDLSGRSAMALSAGLPIIQITGALSIIALICWRKMRIDEPLEVSLPPSRLQISSIWIMFAWLICLLTIGLPVIAMSRSLINGFHPIAIENEIHPQLMTSLIISISTGMIGLFIAVLSAISKPRWLIVLAICNYLIGGQFAAIAMLRIFNGTDLGAWILDNHLAVILAHAGRFSWIALIAGASLHTGPWRAYREMAGVDGADARQIFFKVILGMGWPVLVMAALLIGSLSLTEVPATALLVPPSLIPMLLTWVHMQRYGPMLEASLLLCLLILMIGWICVILFYLGKKRAARFVKIVPSFVLFLLVANGCGKTDQPDAIWCSAGYGRGQVVYPRAITRALDGTFFIVDRAARIQHLDSKGNYLNGWQMQEWAQGKPVGLTIDRDGNLWVPDTHYQRVIVFTPEGREIKRFGKKGTGPGEFDLPTDVAFDNDGNIYVSEYGENNRVQVFDKDFKFLREFGKTGPGMGELSRPQSMVIANELLYVTDSCNHRIAVYQLDGTLVEYIGGVGSAPGEFRFPYGLDLDDQGNLLVAEFGNNRIQKIDPNSGASLWQWGTAGKLPGELNYAWAVAADGDRAIIVDAGNNRLQVVKMK